MLIGEGNLKKKFELSIMDSSYRFLQTEILYNRIASLLRSIRKGFCIRNIIFYGDLKETFQRRKKTTKQISLKFYKIIFAIDTVNVNKLPIKL